jgi:ribonucleoside-diphosphate reductase beta chain
MLTDKRLVYAPFEYPAAFDYFLKQHRNHWIPQEISLNDDVQDYRLKLTDAERAVVSNVTKGFTQAEVLVNDYWRGRVCNWFPKPEICMMATSFAAFEAIHSNAYAYLNDTLGIDNYDSFMYEPTAKAKIDRLIDTPSERIEDIALSLAVFSGFTEGVNLYSSFAILMNFERFNKLKGVGTMITYSVRDESLHSEAGCWLYRTLMSECPELLTKEHKEQVVHAAEMTVSMEDEFIDKVFELGPVYGMPMPSLKNFIRHRTNVKLADLGFLPRYSVDQNLLADFDWFNVTGSGRVYQDFFVHAPTDYAKVVAGSEWNSAFG